MKAEHLVDPVAHARHDGRQVRWHALSDHLLAVSDLSAAYASKFDAGAWGALAGLWHDLGKYREGFQKYI